MEVRFRQLERAQKSVIRILEADAAEIGVTLSAMTEGRGRTRADGELASDAGRDIVAFFARETTHAARVLEMQG